MVLSIINAVCAFVQGILAAVSLGGNYGTHMHYNYGKYTAVPLYRQISNINRTKSPNLNNISRLV